MRSAKTHLTDTETKIYVADLAAYNSGVLHGVWLDASEDMDYIQDKVNDMLKRSHVHDAEELAIYDYEGFAGRSVAE